MKPVKKGVPQGSVIGPLLFAIFTNKMSQAVKNPAYRGSSHLERRTLFGKQCSECGIMTTFADDSTYTITSRTRQSNQINIRRSLDEIECYLNDNKLCINQKKTALTECMIAQKKGRHLAPPPLSGGSRTRWRGEDSQGFSLHKDIGHQPPEQPGVADASRRGRERCATLCQEAAWTAEKPGKADSKGE